MINNEQSFVDTYLQLLELSEKASADTFYSTSEYGKLASLGPTLPKFKYALPGRISVEENSVEITFKSIKPPHKFTKVLKVSKSATVHAVKGELIASLDLPVGPEDIKLLLKSKVLQDTASFDGVPDGTAVSVMISASAPIKAVEVPVVDSSDIDEPELVISESTWEKIHTLLAADLGPGADKVLASFKSVV